MTPEERLAAALRDALLAHEAGADYGYETMWCTCGWRDADAIGLRAIDPESKTWTEHQLRVLDTAIAALSESGVVLVEWRALSQESKG